MFVFAISIGFFSYIIFFLGLVGLLSAPLLQTSVLVFVVLCIFMFRKRWMLFLTITKQHLLRTTRLERLYFGLLLVLLVVNLCGAFVPELSFDALWYHLTLPKLYLIRHRVFFIPGGLLYYSAMPKLLEMYYTVMLSLGSEVYAKLLHFCFGVLSLFALYKLSRELFSRSVSLCVLVLCASNLVFAWEATTAYVDLGRTFFEVMALWAYILWIKKDMLRYLIYAAILVGLAIAVKLLSLGSLVVFLLLLLIKDNIDKREKLLLLFSFSVISVVTVSPWLFFSQLHTGNPVYPFFTKLYDTSIHPSLLSPLTFVQDMVKIFLFSDDPIAPIYLICIPLLLFLFRLFSERLKTIVYYSFFALIVWYITPRTGGGRFLLPYLPAFSLCVGAVIEYSHKYLIIKRTIIILIIITALCTVVYRGVATARYYPVLFGLQSKHDFLSTHLNFSFGDFYDTDNYFASHMQPTDRVLLINFHNMYYVNFPYISDSWVKKGDSFNYIAVQHAALPQRFKSWSRIYTNTTTGVDLYTLDRTFVRY